MEKPLRMTFGSLFAGIGGFDLGLERAGMECRWQVEIDASCNEDLQRHWPDVKRHGDIKTITGHELEPVDLICGGFPCQDLSQAGKRAGIEGPRSGLWFEFARLIGGTRPRYVLIENVAGLLVYDGIRRVVGELARLGYVGCWLSVRASDLGASHQRKRVFIVAYRTGGRLGELRQPSRSGGFADGCQPELEDAARNEQSRRGSGGRGVREASEQLGIPERTRRTATGIGCDIDAGSESEAGCGSMADTGERFIQEPGRGEERRDGVGPAGARDVEYATCAARPRFGHERVNVLGTASEFAPGPGDPRWPAILRERPDLAPALESPLRGMADGLSDWMDGAMQNRTKRLRRLGNAIVPQVAEYIGARLLAFDREHGRGV